VSARRCCGARDVATPRDDLGVVSGLGGLSREGAANLVRRSSISGTMSARVHRGSTSANIGRMSSTTSPSPHRRRASSSVSGTAMPTRCASNPSARGRGRNPARCRTSPRARLLAQPWRAASAGRCGRRPGEPRTECEHFNHTQKYRTFRPCPEMRGLPRPVRCYYSCQAKTVLRCLPGPLDEAVDLDVPAVTTLIVEQGAVAGGVWSAKALVTSVRSHRVDQSLCAEHPG
jgi:hypothetical protein